MSEESSAAWSIDDHIRHGEETIANLLSIDQIGKTDPRVCFHFEPAKIDDNEPWSEDASYNQLAKPLFDALPFKLDVDYVGGTSGIEAWENVIPSVVWLRERVPVVMNIAAQSGLIFAGWSFEPREPRNFSFVSCGPHLNVFNANSPEGRTAIDELIERSDALEAKNS